MILFNEILLNVVWLYLSRHTNSSNSLVSFSISKYLHKLISFSNCAILMLILLRPFSLGIKFCTKLAFMKLCIFKEMNFELIDCVF